MKRTKTARSGNSQLVMRSYRQRQAGQSLAVTVAIMFILLFVGGIFVALVARNLTNAGRGRAAASADELAISGLNFVDLNLMNSPEGADWRPALTPATNPNDPDKLWLDQGYSRVNVGAGRALVRVSMGYDPRNPLGQLIKIESIGRSGVLDPNDPTSFLNTPAPRLRREKIAYKRVGLTDYGRWVTNRFDEAKFEATLGIPNIGVPLTFRIGEQPVRFLDNPSPSWYTTTGARVMVNGNLHLVGDAEFVVDPRRSESVHVAGDITVQNTVNRPRFLFYDPFAGTPYQFTTGNIFGTAETFSTYSGLLRDGLQAPDANGFSRGIPYIAPPLIDQVDPATGVTRYRLLTREAGLLFSRHDGSTFNTGRVGLGAGLYIDNFRNYEQETRAVNGGQSLRSVWLKPGSTNNWNGPHYIAPGAFIEFGYPVTQARDDNGAPIPNQFRRQAGMRIVRDVNDRPWTDPNGQVANRTQTFTFFIYKPAGQRPVLKLESELFRKYLFEEITDGHVPNPKGLPVEQAVDNTLPAFNGVVFAEGNLRVRGLLPSKQGIPIRREPGDTDSFTDQQLRDLVNPPAMNVVSDANIYIEGSIVRESQAADSILALMATNYVVVNTTMFLSPNKAMDYAGSAADAEAPYHTAITSGESGQAPPFALDYLYGDDANLYQLRFGNGNPATDAQGNPMNQMLLMRHGVSPGSTFLNLIINEAFPPTNPPSGCTAGVNCDPLYRFNVGTVPAWVYPMTNSLNTGDLFEQRAFTLLPRPSTVFYNMHTSPGFANTLRPSIDPNYTVESGAKDYLYSRMAVAPLDVRIEAVLYAQNESFFIIPGLPLNTNSADTRDAALRRAQQLGLPAGSMVRPAGTGDLFPFYNEPYDCRITLLGAISECRTASASDQAAWLQLWGYIPEAFGSTGKNPPDTNAEIRIPNEHRLTSDLGLPPTPDIRTQAERNFYGQDSGFARGIRFIYDPALASPYRNYTPGARAYRTDNDGRILPPVPRLPVCPGFAIAADDRP